MAIPINGKFKPRNGGNFKLVDAADVEMPDGTSLEQYQENLELESGHYVPSVVQSEDGKTMTVSFTPNKANLAAVAPVVITLPEGPQGEQGKTGADGGYFTPAVTDNGDGTFTISFAASKSSMPIPAPVVVTIPTPVAGSDYFTQADKAAMVQDVLAALPVWAGGEY